MGSITDRLKTPQSLIDALGLAATRGSSAEEIQDQRLSFVYSSVHSKSDVTRSQVEQALIKHDRGAVASK